MKIGYALDGRYQIKKTLGEGGMANVYLAYDLILKRNVTVKLMRLDLQDDKAAIRRFKREANSLTELINPNIVSIYDIGEDHGMQYLVMEYVDGMDLKQYLKLNYPLSYERVIEIMQQILAAVSEAHAHGIVHRDLKPQNILIDRQGNVKVTDFGIAVAAAEETMTRTNTLMGSVHYISPEQARGSIITKQSDLYSLGIVLFELLTNHLPYEGNTAVAIALKHYQGQMPSVREYDANIPQSLENVILHATAKSLTDRYQTAVEMSADLKTALSPSRQNEVKWTPSEIEDGQTKVLPDLTNFKDVNDDLTQTKKLGTKQSKPSQAKPAPKANFFKRHKRPLLALGIITLIVIIAAVLSLPREATVPDLRGMTRAEAERMLKDEKLEIGSTTYQASEKYSYHQIIASDPRQGTVVKNGAKIDVIVSSGLKKVAFGNYRGKKYKQVKKTLEKHGAIVYKKTKYSDKYAKGTIISQSIDPKQKVAMSQVTVSFTVSLGSKNILLKDLLGESLSKVQAYADKYDLNLVIKHASSNEEKDTIISQYPYAGTYIGRGGNLTVTLSDGPESSSSSASSSSKSKKSSSSSKASSAKTSSSSSSASTSTQTLAQRTVTIPYSGTDGQVVEAKIYLEDKTHSLSSVYKTLQITSDTQEVLSFVLDSNQAGKYKVVVDGEVVVEDNSVTP